MPDSRFPLRSLQLVSTGLLLVFAIAAVSFLQNAPDPKAAFPIAPKVERHALRSGYAGLLWTALWLWLNWNGGKSFAIRSLFVLLIGWSLVLAPSAHAIRGLFDAQGQLWHPPRRSQPKEVESSRKPARPAQSDL